MESTGEDMYLVDSSVWIAFYSTTDVHHARALADIEHIIALRQKIAMSDHVLDEVATYFLYHEGREKALTFLQSVLNNEDIILHVSNAQEIREIADNFRVSRAKLSFTDEVLRFLSDKYDYTLLTYDRDLAKAK